MMLGAVKDPEMAADWSDVGGHVTIASYGTSSADIPAHHWFFLKNTVPYYETETHIFVDEVQLIGEDGKCRNGGDQDSRTSLSPLSPRGLFRMPESGFEPY